MRTLRLGIGYAVIVLATVFTLALLTLCLPFFVVVAAIMGIEEHAKRITAFFGGCAVDAIRQLCKTL